MATIVVEEGRVLLARRREEGPLSGLWEFPGGKVEAGESDEEALIREFQEEFGQSLRPLEAIAETAFSHRGRERSLVAWHASLPSHRELRLHEHLELRWCLPEEIASLALVDSDRKLLPALLAWLGSR